MAVPLASFITGFDETLPSLELAVIDPAEIPHVPLHLATGTTLVLDD
jgi:hypothetical protein